MGAGGTTAAALVIVIGGLTVWLYSDVMQHDMKNFQE